MSLENIHNVSPCNAQKTAAERERVSLLSVSQRDKDTNAVPIPGSKNQERIFENLGGWNVRLNKEEFRTLESALDIDSEPEGEE